MPFFGLLPARVEVALNDYICGVNNQRVRNYKLGGKEYLNNPAVDTISRQVVSYEGRCIPKLIKPCKKAVLREQYVNTGDQAERHTHYLKVLLLVLCNILNWQNDPNALECIHSEPD